MEQRGEREFTAESARASTDLRTDIVHIVVAIAILAGISTFDSDRNPPVTQEASLSQVK